MVQGFFARFLGLDSLRGVDPRKGRFRAFLLASFRHYLADQHDRDRAVKRGGGSEPVSIEWVRAERELGEMRLDERTPETLFDRRWAFAVLEEAARRLEVECEREGRSQWFALLTSGRVAAVDSVPRERSEEQPGIPANTVKSHLHRLRVRHRQLVREVIAETVSGASEVNDELRHLLAVIQS
jgi:hypothetical protein